MLSSNINTGDGSFSESDNEESLSIWKQTRNATQREEKLFSGFLPSLANGQQKSPWSSVGIYGHLPLSYTLPCFWKKESVRECIFRWHEIIQLDANTWQDLYIFNYWNSSFNLLSFLHKQFLETSKPHPIFCSCSSVVIFSWQPLFLAWEEIISNRYPSSSIAAPSGMHEDL